MTFVVLISVLCGAFAVLAWRNFKLALTTLLALLPTYLIRFSIGPVPLTVLEALILILIIVWAVKHGGWKLDLVRGLGAFRSPLLLLLVSACLAGAYAPDVFSALGIWKAYFIEPAFVFIMLKTTIVTPHDWRRILWALIASAAVIGLGAIAQVVTGLGIPAPWDVELRATSIFDFPNAVGLFVAPVLSAGIVYAATLARSRQEKIAIGMASALMLAGVVLAHTESALVAIPAALLLTLVLANVKPKTKIMAVVGCAIVGIALFISSTTVREKLLLQDLSGQVRRSQWSETLAMLADRPVLGAGLNGYPTHFAPYHDPTLYEIFQYPHTLILNIWSELGLLGVVTFLWLATVVIVVSFTYRKHPFTLIAFAALATMTIHGMADVAYFKNDLAVLTWFFIALASSHPSLKRE